QARQARGALGYYFPDWRCPMRWGWILWLSGTFLIADVAHAQPPAPAPAKTPAQAPAKEPSNKSGFVLPIADTAKPWRGDLDGMIKRRAIRVLVPYSRTYYFIDRAVQRGLAYDISQLAESEINKQLQTRH